MAEKRTSVQRAVWGENPLHSARPVAGTVIRTMSSMPKRRLALMRSLAIRLVYAG